MSEGKISIRKAIPIIVLTWILSLVTTLGIAYFTPFVPIKTNQIDDSAIASNKIGDSAIITTKLANGSITSAKILDGAIIGQDLADNSIITVKVADGAITTAKIANSSITAAKIPDNAIVTVKLADGAVTTAKILDGSVTTADLSTNAVTTINIADGAITNSKLASQAIPFVSTRATGATSTTETINYVDMGGMSVTLSLTRTSHLIIMFSAEAFPDYDARIFVRAMVGTEVAEPGPVYLTPIIFATDTSSYLVGISAYSFNFYKPSLSSGIYTIKIQWRVSNGTGDVYNRALTAVALPA